MLTAVKVIPVLPVLVIVTLEPPVNFTSSKAKVLSTSLRLGLVSPTSPDKVIIAPLSPPIITILLSPT
mgnify:CR=1 FL=1